jgi:hypothetical protein
MRSLISNLCVFFVLSLASCSAQQKVAVLKIKIVDEQKIGLPEANVKISSSNKTINFKANLEGNIDVKNFKTGFYQVSVFAVGYFNLSNYTINIANNNTMIEIEMKQLKGLKSASVEWSGGWVTLEDKQGKIISIRSKKKE